eukprot:TRINITY_DN24954_c0_g1_i5.p2 TRINITY_DN24954_c0_g1~~TRINITY_DN24954_c0_g1_i5.p2  ORF type:complete len:130 (-),score=20.38 TRINITY_DN24954_c0_g1_i5:70-459(-)
MPSDLSTCWQRLPEALLAAVEHDVTRLQVCIQPELARHVLHRRVVVPAKLFGLAHGLRVKTHAAPLQRKRRHLRSQITAEGRYALMFEAEDRKFLARRALRFARWRLQLLQFLLADAWTCRSALAFAST